MNKQKILTILNAAFHRQELNYLVVGAGAALVLHGAKDECGDIDLWVHLSSVFDRLAQSKSAEVFTPKSGVGKGFKLRLMEEEIEVFYHPELYDEVNKSLITREEVINGVRVDSPSALVNWYIMMNEKFNRPKDWENLKLAASLLT